MAENDVQGEWTLPDRWVWTTIGKACEVNPRMTRPEQFDDDTVVSFVPMAAVDDVSGAIVNPETRPVGEVWKGYKRFAEGDVIFAKITPCMENGKAAIAKGLVNGIGLGSTEFHVLRPLGGIPPQWVYYFVRQESFRGDAAARMTGTAGQLRVPTAFMQEADIPLGPLPEQRRIVAEIETQFTRLDAAVAALERARANLRRYKASVLKAACEGRLVPTEAELARGEGRDYDPADQLLARILVERRARWETEQWDKEVEKARQKAAKAVRKAAGHPLKRGEKLAPEEWQDLPEDAYGRYLPKDDRWKQKYKEPAPPDTEGLPELPEGWVWANLEQLSWNSRYGTSQKCTYNVLGPPVLRIPNISNGRFDLGDVKLGTKPDELERMKSLARNDLLIIRTNGSRDLIGRSALVRRSFDQPTYFASYLIRFRLVDTNSLPIWVAAIWDAPMMREWIERVAATSAGQYNISIGSLNQLPIPLSPTAEQRRIVAEVERRLSLVAALEASLVAALARAGRLRQAVLKRAFEGRLVPQDPSDEPASVLLERIRAKREGKGERKQARQMRLPGT